MTDSKIKEIFLEVFEAKFGSVIEACKGSHISRQTFYSWYRKFPNFKKSVEAIRTGLIDVAESKLHINVNKGNQKAIEFALTNLKPDKYSKKDQAPAIGNITVIIEKKYPNDKVEPIIVKEVVKEIEAKREEDPPF